MRFWSHGAASKIAATVAAVAVTGAFGVGAYAVAQGGATFDPKGFTSAYSKDAQGSQKGYKATTEKTDSAANRHEDNAENDDASAQEAAGDDAFSKLPENGSGTTAVSVSTNAKPGTSTTVNDGKGDGSSNGNGTTGPAAGDDSDDDNSGNNGGSGNGSGGGSGSGDNSGGSGSGDNGGSGSGGNSGGGNSGGGSNGGGGGNTGTTVEEDRGNTSNPYEPEKDQVDSSDGFQAAGTGPSTNNAIYYPSIDIKSDMSPCIGEQVSSWDLFCSMDTRYFDYTDIFNLGSFIWTYKDRQAYDNAHQNGDSLFYVTGISYTDKNTGETITISFSDEQETITIPDTEFNIHFEYRFNAGDDKTTSSLADSSWTGDLCTPAFSRVYLVGSDGKPAGSYAITSKGESINLLKYSKELLQSEGALGDTTIKCSSPSWKLSKLITGWYETDSKGKSPDEIPDSGDYAPSAGYHTIKASYTNVKKGTTAHLISEYDDIRGMAWYIQALTNVDFAVAKTNNGVYSIQKGIQAIRATATDKVEAISLPSTALRVGAPYSSLDPSAGAFVLRASKRYAISSPNSTFEESDGCIIDHEQNAIVEIPIDKDNLTIPAGIGSVTIQPENKLKRIQINAIDAEDLPDISFTELDPSCIIQIKSNALREEALVKYARLLSNGNEILSEDGSSTKLIDGTLMDIEKDCLLNVPDNGNSTVTISNVASIGKTAFESNESVKTVFLEDIDDCAFEEGCFENGTISTVVCETAAQAKKAEASLTSKASGVKIFSVAEASNTDNGIKYIETAAGTAILLQAPNSGISYFDGELSNGLKVEVIGPRAFSGNKDLTCLKLGKSTTAIAMKAFYGCTNLNEVFLGTENCISFGSNAFRKCDSIGIFASNAKKAIGITDSFFDSQPYAAYCPTDNSGYNNSFTCFEEKSNVASYSAVMQDNDSFILYGCTDGADWLCLAAPSELPSKVELPESTVEIYKQAFSGTTGPSLPTTRDGKETTGGFSIDFSKLSKLDYIDEAAFDGSELTGEVHFGDHGNSVINIYRNAFQDCEGLASFSCDTLYLDLYETAFANCTNLKNVVLACTRYLGASISPAVFYGCSNLESIEFTTTSQPVQLLRNEDKSSFVFASSELDEKIRLIVPDDQKESYLRSWLYSFADFGSYDEALSKAAWSLRNDPVNPCKDPTEGQIVQKANELLLKAENNLRERLGMEQVDTTTFAHKEVAGGVTLWLDGSTQAIAINVASGSKKIDFTTDIFSAWNEIVLQKDAFANAGSTLEDVILSDKVTVIKDGAFNGCGDITLKLANTVPTLHGGSPHGDAFSFGANSISIISESEAIIDGCREKWPRQMLGFDTEAALDDYARDFLWMLTDPSKSEISKAVNDKLKEQENAVLSWFGRNPLGEDNDPSWVYSSPYGADPEQGEDSEAGSNDMVKPNDGNGSITSDGEANDKGESESSSTSSNNTDSGESKDNSSSSGSSNNSSDTTDTIGSVPETPAPAEGSEQ